MPTLALSNYSRYKDTAVYADADATRFALWEPPAEFTDPALGWQIHRVAQNEVGFLDMLAAQYYGQGFEQMWWVIAQANALLDPEREMYPGMVLVIPPRAAVQQFLARLGDGET
jgi:hypothetical protein